jgi:hypothetical protein
MLHMLHRRDVREARLAQTTARAVHVAVAPTAGIEGSGRNYSAFMAEQEDVIHHDRFAEKPIGPTTEELAAFDRIAAAAL